ncbi:MAG: hypothetical protein DHS20C16_08110 [Phycisphaerae bacterium]|nr:MAG: hypothetical protein DHS20C16_08110 [Phycisphaerae bacterium]
MSTFGQTTNVFRASLLVAIAAVIGFANQASAQCAFFDDFQRPDSSTVGFGWVEVESLAPEILLTSSFPFSFVDVVGTGIAPASLTQSNIDTSSLTDPAVTFIWQARNGNAEANDLLQVDWRTSGGVWQQLDEFDLTNTLTTVEELPLPPAAMNTSIDIRFVIIVDEFQEGILLDDVGVCEAIGPPDCNSNGIDDQEEVAGGSSPDLNNNNIPDECDECVFDIDCSNGLYCDGFEICQVDVCQFGSNPCQPGQLCDEDFDVCFADGSDCNSNGVGDSTDISGGTSLDVNGNSVPDECDECVTAGDCDDGMFCTGVETCNVDTCESSGDPCGTGQVCNETTDACDPDGLDCNNNGIADATDISGGTSDDLNANSVPDECDECVFDADCDDGMYCTGVETCNVDTCVPGTDPCLTGQTCDEGTDSCPPTGADCNNNGIGDATDIAGATSDDTNVNGIPDECDECTGDGDCDDGLFCNGAETCDTDTCMAGTNPCSGGEICDEGGDVCVINTDCNSNGIDDSLDIAGPTSDDVNANSVPDECDECLVDGDCNDGDYCNGEETCDVDRCVAGAIPCAVGQSCDEPTDTCSPIGNDCNNNGIGDATDIAGATSDDANANTVPDECDECVVDGDCDDGLFCNGAETCNTDTCDAGSDPCLLGEVCVEATDTCEQPDCNTNGVGDLDDIAGGTSPDANSNGVPDECEGCTTNAECDDGLFCNGAEVCNAGTCESPGNTCLPGQSCDEATDTCQASSGGGGGGPPPDGDGDGVADGSDDCADTPTGEAVDENGCSESQLDDDDDGVFNDADICADTPSGETVNAAGCSASQLDSDGDGVTNDVDTCPNTPSDEQADADGCSDSQLDDGDPDPDPQPGPGDDVDTNGQTPDDGDGGSGDGGDGDGDNDSVDDPDSDGDGVPDSIDECALTPEGYEVNSVGCALISPDPNDDDNGETDGCANGLGCGAGGAATLMMMVLGFGGLKYNRRRIGRPI